MPAEKYMRPGDTAPNLVPLPQAGTGSPREVWRRYYSLPKEPLRLVRTVSETESTNFDSLLGLAVLEQAEVAWDFNEHVARVIPLPLALLGIVPLERPHKRLDDWRVPVWACTTIKPTGAGDEVICIGHADTLRQLLEALDGPDAWTVTPLPISEDDAREIIAANRPMPGGIERFSPPYWFDWVGEAKEGPYGNSSL